MPTEAASPATTAATTLNFPRPPRGSSSATTSGASRSRGPRRGGAGAGGAPRGTFNKSAPSESTDWASAQEDPSDNMSEEVAQLKIKYSNQLKFLKDIFPDWTSENLVFALQEVDGDVTTAADRIAGGQATQWGQVKKKPLKDKPKSIGRSEGAVAGIRGRGRGGSERGADRGNRGRGDGRGRGRGRGGETRSRGRGAAAGVSSDATSTAATIASDETPVAWPDTTSADDTTITDRETKDLNGINGTKPHEEIPAAPLSVWGQTTATKQPPPPVEEAPPANGNGAPPQRPTVSSTPSSREHRIVDGTRSWAKVVQPEAPAPTPKPAPLPKSAPVLAPPQQQTPPALQASPRPSTHDQDITEEPAQTIHDPFSAAQEPSKPKVQLPQPVLPYIPSMVPKEQPPPAAPAPPAEPLTSHNLDLLEDQQSPVLEPPAPSVTAHRVSPAPKSDGPPGLGPRFSRPTRENPVIMPSMASQSIGGMQIQFGSMDLNQDMKPAEKKEESLHQAPELETAPQPTPNQQRASPAAQLPQPSSQPQSQRIPSAQGQSQGQPAYQPPTAFGGLIPAQAQRFSAPAPGLTQSKDFTGFPYDQQQFQNQSGSGYGDYLYGAGGQGQYDIAPREYYNYYQHQRPPTTTNDSQQRPTTANQSTTPSNTETTATPNQFGSTTPGSTNTQPTPAPSTHSQQPHHPQQYPGMHPYWSSPYYANQMYQHYGGYPYYNQHKGMYQGQGYGASQYGAGQQGGYDRYSNRDQSGYDAFSRMGYGGGQQQQQQQPTPQPQQPGQNMQPHGSQQSSTTGQDDQSTDTTQNPQQQQPTGQSYSGYPSQSRLPYGLGQQTNAPSQQQGYQHHYPPQQQQQPQSHAYGGYNPGYNTQAQGGNSGQSQQPSQTQSSGGPQNQRGGGQQQPWGQSYGSH